MKRVFIAGLSSMLPCANAALAADPLPSWNDGAVKQRIVSMKDEWKAVFQAR